MGIVETASFITAFIAGAAALLAPCCIGVLLPSYLGSVFKTRTKIFLMTFVYYLGLLTIFLPLGLGIASLGSFFSSNHAIFFTIGGLFMLALGTSMILGKSVMLPMRVHPKLQKYDLGSIYSLGVFSGIATTCCAPVLAGVLALSAIPGSLPLGTLYALTFVTGMVAPLFVVALFVDRFQAAKKLQSFKRKINYKLAGRDISVNLSHLIAGVIYMIFGAFILIFERTNSGGMSSSYQTQINLLAAQSTRWVSHFTKIIPNSVWAIVFGTLFLMIGWSAYRQATKGNKSKKQK